MEKDKTTDKTPEKKSLFEFFGVGRHQPVSEDEIKDMVSGAGELLEDEKRMIHDILDLRDMAVREIMKPRVDMMLVEDTETGRAALERMRGTGYSRLPVFHDDMDAIVGIVHYKDLIGPLMDGRIDDPVTKFMYEPMFVPETKDVIPLLSEMQEQRQQMAIVVDEYGGTDGLITVEDIVEEIVGEINDETDRDRDAVTLLDAGTWRADGSFPVEDALELGWPVCESDDYETIAGWLMDTLDTVPKTGDEFEVDGFSFKIEKMRR
ncbi:MAG: HlyC/CorC family transporter [Eggerthellaceae bacterium]|nr:HlyC/CorC family transporter [Eggerthellaceae bacterium]